MDRDVIYPSSRNGSQRTSAAALTMARENLESARAALDRAVAALPDVDGDEAMATPKLLLLLVGAVKARENLDKLEALRTSHFAEA
jgi:hypothetical protein